MSVIGCEVVCANHLVLELLLVIGHELVHEVVQGLGGGQSEELGHDEPDIYEHLVVLGSALVQRVHTLLASFPAGDLEKSGSGG